MPVDNILLGLLCLVVWGSLLAIGGVHLLSLLVVGAVATGGAAFAFASGCVTRVPPAAGIALALGVYTCIQALPMPLSWLAALSPIAADTWSRALLPFGEPAPAWATLSLVPRLSLVEALKWWTYACVFVLAAGVSRVRGPKAGVAIVFVSGTLAAGVTLVHGLLGSSQVFGLYEPKFVPGRWAVGPLLNTNNLSGYLNLAIFCGVGLLFGNSRHRFRYWIAFRLVVLIATSLLAASRGGVIGLLLGSGLLVPAGLSLRRRSAVISRRTLGALALFATLGLALALIGGTRETWRALYDANLAKLELAVWTKPIVEDHPWFGVGRGAFETVLPAYHDASGHMSYTHPENFIAQWVTEWGLLVALLALAAFAWVFRSSRLQVRRSVTAMGAGVGVLALLAQNLVDLAFEVPAVVIALAVVLNA
ncbi:MAG TPA: O-antigen ligase family protein, partial [Polyangiaceae bacterium]|nr:O-antigen ligase family protein [Polyangiaceae bacterium]